MLGGAGVGARGPYARIDVAVYVVAYVCGRRDRVGYAVLAIAVVVGAVIVGAATGQAVVVIDSSVVVIVVVALVAGAYVAEVTRRMNLARGTEARELAANGRQRKVDVGGTRRMGNPRRRPRAAGHERRHDDERRIDREAEARGHRHHGSEPFSIASDP